MLSNLLDTHIYRFLSNKTPTFSAITRGGEGISFFKTTPTYAFATNSATIYGSEIPMKHSGVAQLGIEAAAPKGSLLEESSCNKWI